MVTLVVAVSENFCIGKDNGLLWHLPADMAFFKKVTSGGTVLMGRKTYLSIPEKFRPLPNRENIVVSKDQMFVDELNNKNHPCLKAYIDLHQAIEIAEKNQVKELFVIGGAVIYKQTFERADKLIVTHVAASFAGDAHFPAIDPQIWTLVDSWSHPSDEKNQYHCTFNTYLKKQS